MCYSKSLYQVALTYDYSNRLHVEIAYYLKHEIVNKLACLEDNAWIIKTLIKKKAELKIFSTNSLLFINEFN